MSAFGDALAFTLEFEGGYSNHPADAGGATRYGITQRFARAKGYDGDMRELPLELARKWYRELWDRYELDDIAYHNAKVAAYLFDMAVNHGKWVLIAQRAVGRYQRIKMDGIWGKETKAALMNVASRRAQGLLDALRVERCRYVKDIVERKKSQSVFLFGWLRRYLATALLLLLACNNHPTTPDRTLATSAILSGKVLHQFTGLPVAGVEVRYQNATAFTNGSGLFTVNGISNGVDLRFRAGSILERRTWVGGTNVWKVVPSSFDTAAYRDVARQISSRGTVRWAALPKIYIDTRPRGNIPLANLQAWISEVRAQVPSFVSGWSAKTLLVTPIVTAAPPADFTAGTIVIHFSELASDYFNGPYIGYARLIFDSDHRMIGGAVWLRYKQYSSNPSKRKGILGHELGHVLGYGHMDRSSPVSMMYPSIGSKTTLAPYDSLAARFLYGRNPKHQAPDIDSRIGTALKLAGNGYWEGP